MPTIEQLTKLLEADPEDTFVLYGLAQAHQKAGNMEQAVAFYDRVLAIDPAYCYAYFHKARALEADDRTDEAVAAVRVGLEAAQRVGDGKAAGELAQFLDELT